MILLYFYWNGGFLLVNKLLDKIWYYEDYKRYKKKVINVVFWFIIVLFNIYVLCGVGV